MDYMKHIQNFNLDFNLSPTNSLCVLESKKEYERKSHLDF